MRSLSPDEVQKVQSPELLPQPPQLQQLRYPLITPQPQTLPLPPQPQPQTQPQYPLHVNSELPQPPIIEYTKNEDYPLYVPQEDQLEQFAHYRPNTSQLPKPQQQYPLVGLGNELPQPSIGYSPNLDSIIKYVEENQILQPPRKEKSDIERESEIIYFISEFKKLIQNGEQINYRNDLGQTLLIRSVIEENYAVTKALLRVEQVDVNAVDNMNHNALHYASSIGNIDIIQAFAKREDVNFNAFAGSHNVTALQIASKNGFDEVVQALIDANASVDICNSDEHTALHVAIFFGKEKVVEVLLKAGADLDRLDINGNTALDIAKNIIEDETKRDTIIKLLTTQKVDLKKSEDKALLEDKATPAKSKNVKRKAPDDLNENPTNNLRIASSECNFDEVKKLLGKGVDPNETIKHSPMALVALSTSKGDYEKIRTMALLYKHGGKIDGDKFFENLDDNEWISKDLKENIIKLNSQNRESVDKFMDVIDRAKFEKDKAQDDEAYKEIKATKEIAPSPVVYPINTQQVKKVRFNLGGQQSERAP